MEIMMKLLGLVSFVLMTSNGYAGSINPFVKNQLKAGATAPVIVVLKSQSDFSGMNFTKFTRTQRVAVVYKTLVENANNTQKNILTFFSNIFVHTGIPEKYI